MWNRPQLMKDVADLLFAAAAAALLVAGAVWVARLPLFPVREVSVTQPLRELRAGELEAALQGLLRGNFFSVNLDVLRRSVEELPWVRRADVRRIWPAGIEIGIEEHVPAAFWGQATGQLVNTHGEIFSAKLSAPPAPPMPVLSGPSALSGEMLGYYRRAEEVLRPLGRTPRALIISPRLAVQMRLDDGMIVELGRDQNKSPVRGRLERFVEHYATVMHAAGQRPAVVDMRYPNGFALRVGSAAETANKGKP